MTPERSAVRAEAGTGEAPQADAGAGPSEWPFSEQDPNSASIRIDLSGIGAHTETRFINRLARGKTGITSSNAKTTSVTRNATMTA